MKHLALILFVLLSGACASVNQVRVQRPVVEQRVFQNIEVVTTFEALYKALIAHPFSVVIFSTSWCGPCRYVESYWEGREGIGNWHIIVFKILPEITDSQEFLADSRYERFYNFMTKAARPSFQRGVTRGFPACSVIEGPLVGGQPLRNFVKVQLDGADGCTSILLEYLKPRVAVRLVVVNNYDDFWSHVANARNALILFDVMHGDDQVRQNTYQNIVEFLQTQRFAPDFLAIVFQLSDADRQNQAALQRFVDFTRKFDSDVTHLLPLCVTMTNIRRGVKISDLVRFRGSEMEECTVGLFNWMRENQYR